VTAIPLLLFAIAARRLPLSMMAFLQYLAPTIAFLIGVLVYHEPLDSPAHAEPRRDLGRARGVQRRSAEDRRRAPGSAAAMSFDTRQFKRIERAGYDRLGPRYLAAAATRDEIATALLDAAALAPGQRVLDLASGPGLLARAAAARVGGRGLVLASDISQGQLRLLPDLPRVAADGEALPLAGASVDRVLCGLGLMFFPDEDAALREMRRVLRPGGRIAFRSGRRRREVPLIECALACMRRLLPPPKVARPSIFRCGDPEWLRRRIASADFHDIEIRPLDFSVSFADAGQLLAGLPRHRRRRQREPFPPARRKVPGAGCGRGRGTGTPRQPRGLPTHQHGADRQRPAQVRLDQ
jgi:ubiquinone/menaquinone biosynthesis C-methylase UbiE